MEFDVRKSLVYLTVAGSRAYGINTSESDTDIKGMCVAPLEYYLGFAKVFNQHEFNGMHDWVEDLIPARHLNSEREVEGTVYDIKKFLKLCADCNPNMIELLFMDEDCILFCSPEMEKILEHRDKFISKKARFSFSGYAISQLKRIRTHRKWLIDPPQKRPERKDYDLPDVQSAKYNEAESLIRKEIDSWAFHDLELSNEVQDAIKRKITEQLTHTLLLLNVQGLTSEDVLDSEAVREAAMSKIGFDDNLMDLLSREHRYRMEKKKYDQYQTWKRQRNKERAELEAKHKYDIKHAMHLIRLLRMGKEILTEGKVVVKRPDAEELLAIRRGEWSYDEVEQYATDMEKELEHLYKTSTLRKSSDMNTINALCVNILMSKISHNEF